jgi:hypothetical protein
MRLLPPAVLALLTILLAAPSATSQDTPSSKSADPYKSVVDRLQAITTLAEPEWRFHDDIPHAEDPNLDDSGWQTMKVEDEWASGVRALRRWIEIPEKIDGYAVRGASVKLDLFLTSPGRVLITVFSNGAMVFHGDDDQQQMIKCPARPKTSHRCSS